MIRHRAFPYNPLSFSQNYASGDAPLKENFLGLIIYGVILFPHIDEYVDMAAIDAFLTYRDKGENPIEGEEYNTLFPRAIFVVVTHVFHNKCKMMCPMEDFRWCFVKLMSNKEWTQYLRRSTDKVVCWYPKWNEKEDLGYRGTYLVCGVWLGGTKQRVVKENKAGMGKRHQKGREWGPRSCGTSTSYKTWLRLRVEHVRLPLNSTLLATEKDLVVDIPESEEIKELKKALGRMEKEKRILERKLE
ncbi:hypothetical protein CR513_53169, partial [Mucuna pruriens]